MDAARLLRKRFEQENRQLEMTSAQLYILGRLSRNEGINQARLASILDMEPITVCRHVDRMEAAGLIERRADPQDRRSRLLVITDKGKALIPGMRAAAQTVLEEAQSGLSARERKALLDTLERFVSNLSTRPADPGLSESKERRGS
jgi:MarR family transcriptional regulator, transcriptional regulator for hemolysin